MMTFKNVKYLAGAALASVAAFSQAAPVTIDTGDVTAQIAAGATAISAIGIAVLSIYALGKCYKMVKSAF